MGFRTTIILNNDHLDLLKTDPDIGNKIYQAACGFNFFHDGNIGNLGQVVDVSHADVARVGILCPNGTFSFAEMASSTNWQDDNIQLNLLKEAADKLGYRLVKKSTKTNQENVDIS